MLVILHGTNAPSDALLKKWSAAGEFRECRSTADDVATTEEGSAPKRAPGRPGLQLLTDKAVSRVYELWPQLADADPKSIFEEAVARTARQLASAIGPLVHDKTAAPAPVEAPAPQASAPASLWQQKMEDTLAALSHDIKDLKREMAQFSAMRNNLMTRLDEVVTRSREAMLTAGRGDGGGTDPIVEARRDRDMALIKSSMEQILSALERLEAPRGA